MKKKDILKVLDIAGLVSIVVATVLVMIYQFTASFGLIKFAIILYTTAFLILTTFFALKTYFVYKKTQEDGVQIFDLDKKDKGLLIAKLVLSAMAFVFTLVVLVLY